MPKPPVFCLEKCKEKFSRWGIDTPFKNLRCFFNFLGGPALVIYLKQSEFIRSSVLGVGGHHAIEGAGQTGSEALALTNNAVHGCELFGVTLF
jgi:hypothetical protein